MGSPRPGDSCTTRAAPGAPATCCACSVPATSCTWACSRHANSCSGSRRRKVGAVPAQPAGPAHELARCACVRAPRLRRERPGAERTRPVDSFRPGFRAVTADTGPLVSGPGRCRWTRGALVSGGTSLPHTHLRGGLGSQGLAAGWTARRASLPRAAPPPPALFSRPLPLPAQRSRATGSPTSATRGMATGTRRRRRPTAGTTRGQTDIPRASARSSGLAAAAAPTHRSTPSGRGPRSPESCPWTSPRGSRSSPQRSPPTARAPAGAALAHLAAAEVGARGTPGARGSEPAARLDPGWTTAVGAPGGQGVRDPGSWALGYMGSLHQGADREGHGGPGSLQPRLAAPALLQPVPPRDPSPASTPRYRPHRGKALGQLSLAAPRVSRSHVRGGRRWNSAIVLPPSLAWSWSSDASAAGLGVGALKGSPQEGYTGSASPWAPVAPWRVDVMGARARPPRST